MTLPPAAVVAVNHAINHAMRRCVDRRGVGYCSTDWAPRLVDGDCKQIAAAKLRELIVLGAGPRDFVIWIVRVPGHKGTHAVLIERSTGLVLDNYIGGQLESRRFKERHEGYTFLRPCEACGDAAREDAARIRSYVGQP